MAAYTDTLSDHLRAARQAAGLTQIELGRKVGGVPQPLLSAIETGVVERIVIVLDEALRARAADGDEVAEAARNSLPNMRSKAALKAMLDAHLGREATA